MGTPAGWRYVFGPVSLTLPPRRRWRARQAARLMHLAQPGAFRRAREERDGEEVRQEGVPEGRTRDAREKARSVEERPVRQESDQPQAGDRDRAVRGTPVRREGSAEEVVEVFGLVAEPLLELPRPVHGFPEQIALFAAKLFQLLAAPVVRVFQTEVAVGRR